MKHAVIRDDNGRYLDGRYLTAIIDAVEKDKTTVVIDGDTVEIIQTTVDKDGNKETRVRIL